MCANERSRAVSAIFAPMIAKPQTTSEDITARINRYAEIGGSYVSSTDIAWRAVKRDIDALIKVDPEMGWSLYGSWNSKSGNLEEAERGFRAALQLGNSIAVVGNWVVHKQNSGLFRDALDISREYGEPTLGNFVSMFPKILRSGGIHTAVDYLEQAKRMNIDLGNLDTSDAELADDLLKRAGLTDEEISRHLDLAGEILRKHKQLWVGEDICRVRDIDGVYSGVTFTFPLKLSPMEVFECNCELADAEISAGIKRHPFFDVVFSAA
ncbi:hypothetical protein [Pandoraea sp. SD6-2]|uniref:hypothetical protein n=1 Tax=Pandoraea sp. SD6-2 TaxID=1286093 RepID=UPI00032EFCE2|nr:hypothetical protein [Pandoraea sp. SD6-2]EON10624.1 hypothetical protein C266_25400 [Pandoraea sp. SD6-2]